MARNFTYSVYSDNTPGLLNRITVLFTRRKMNIESLTVSETEMAGVSRFTIVVHTDRETAEKIARQIRRNEDVHEVFVSEDSETVHREIALFKIRKDGSRDSKNLQLVLAATVVEESDLHVVLEKTGSEEQIQQALDESRKLGLVEFIRSGRVALRHDGGFVKALTDQRHDFN